MALQIRRGTDAERLTITPAEGELIYTTDTKLIYVGDGSTVGGTKADSGITDLLSDSSPQLGGNLDLNTQTITGTGQINITGNITGTVISGNSGNFTSSVIGSLQASSVQGDLTGSVFANDSTMLVDGTDGKLILSNNNIQDLSNVYVPSTPSGGDALIWNAVDSRWEAGNVSVAGGVFDGDMQGSLFADDSTLMIDGVNQEAFINKITTFNLVPTSAGGIVVDNNIPGQPTLFIIESEAAQPAAVLSRVDETADYTVSISTAPYYFGLEQHFAVGPNTETAMGSISFNAIDINGTNSLGGYIIGQNDGLVLGHSIDGSVLPTKTLRIFDGFVTVGDVLGIEALTIDGGIYATSTIYSQSLKSNIMWEDSTVFMNLSTGTINGYDATFNGRVTVNELAGDVLLSDSTKIIDHTNGTVTAGGFVQFGSYNTTERNALTAANGMIIYNSQVNRFQGYQNGAWINIDDGTAA